MSKEASDKQVKRYFVYYYLAMSRNTMKKRFSLKDHLFNKESVTYLGELFASVDVSFNKKQFVDEVMKRLLKLELKERIVWIAEVLEHHLPTDFKKASKIIVKALPSPLDPSKTDNDFGSFIFAPLGEYVVRNGLTKTNIQQSYKTLLELTQRFSMEDALRSFINEHPEVTFEQLQQWSTHKHYHVRRLVSETTRPYLPWSRRLTTEITKPIPFLDQLHADSTRFVTRSVANHLNDISKKHPELVVNLLQKWKQEGKQDQKELQWITSHSLRTLVKRGDTNALLLLGYRDNPKITVDNFSISKASEKVSRDGVLSFSFSITAKEEAELMVDYLIDFVKAKGQTKAKVFKIKKVTMKKGETISITKNHRFVSDATTYTLHTGKHTVTLQINGKKFDSAHFTVTH